MTAPREFLHVLTSAERGGCERCASMLMRHLPEVRHRALVLRQGGPMCDDFRDAGAAVDVVPLAEVRTNRALVNRLERYVADHPPAAVVVWHGMVWLPQILYGLRHSAAPVGVYGGNPAHTLPRWVDWRFVALDWIYPVRKRPVYVCCSKYVADSFDGSRYLRRFPRAVVLNGVPVPEVDAHEPRPPEEGRPFTVGMLARLDRMKDHATLLRAFALLRAKNLNVRLELAGGGDQFEPLLELASGLNVAGAVRFHGDIADVYGVMAGWDALAYATTDREGLGSALIEGMMLGLPCVVTDVGPVREVCGRPGAALLVPPADPPALADALAKLAAGVELRRSLGRVGRKTALELFHPVHFARQYAELLLGG